MTDMSKRGSNRSTTVEAKITKWFTKQARNEYQESTDKDSPEQGADGAKTIEAEVTLHNNQQLGRSSPITFL